MLKAILFDLDGTLMDRANAVRELLTAQHDAFGSMLRAIPRSDYVARIMSLDRVGAADKDQVYRDFAAEAGLPEASAGQLFEHFVAAYPSFCCGFPEVLPALQQLHALGLSLGVVTNGKVRVQEKALAQLGLGNLLGTVLISEREGVRKPAPEIFERALARLGCQPCEAWYVGDNPEVDVAGARAAGLTAVWRHSDAWPAPNPPALTIHGINELPPMVLAARASGSL